MKTIKILSIDGGGMKGIIPATILNEIHKRLVNSNYNLPFHKIFDLIAGTSTGGIITLSLTVPIYGAGHDDVYSNRGGIKPDKIIELYEKMGSKVFPESLSNRNVLSTIKQLFKSKYPNEPLENVFSTYLKNTTVKKSLTNILVTAYDTIEMQPFFFKKRPYNKGGKNDPNFLMKDAALSTSSVPTYFQPISVRSLSKPVKKYCLIDGGVFSINPSLCAYIEAKKIFNNTSNMLMVSLGTGVQNMGYPCSKVKKWGFFEWIAPWNDVPLISVMGEGQRISTEHMLSKLPGLKMYRFNIPLDKGKGNMDDGSSQNISYLKIKAGELIRKYDREIDEVCSLLHS